MADLRTDVAFEAAVRSTLEAIQSMAERDVPDATALIVRRSGWNHLQGHLQSILPLAVLYARSHFEQMEIIRALTDLDHNMGVGSREAYDQGIWLPVRQTMPHFLHDFSNDIISNQLGSGMPQTVAEVAETYLSASYCGGQPNGGGGTTVFKRTLKLLAHTQRAL